MKRLRLGAALTALFMLATAAFVPAGVSAEGETADVVPDWFNSDQIGIWWMADEQQGASDGNGRFLASSDNSKWTYTYRWGSEKLIGYGNGYNIDFSATPYLNFTAETVGESFTLRLRCYNSTGQHSVDVAVVQAGKQTVSIDLTGNYEFMKTVGSDKRLHINGIEIKRNGFGSGETITISSFRFSATKGENKNDRYWLDAVSDYNWYNWNVNQSSGRFSISHHSNGFLQIKLVWNGTTMQELNNQYSTKRIDLNYFTRFRYATPYMERDLGIYLIVMPTDPTNDSIDWDGSQSVYLGKISGGAAGSGYFDLAGNTELLSLASSDKKLYVKGIKLDIGKWEASGLNVNLSDLSFRMADGVTADCSFADGGTRISASGDSDTYTVSANVENLTGTDAVKYQWYIDGELSDKTDATITLDNKTVGKHTVRSVVTVGNVPYFNTKFFESETYTYGKYTAGNISLSGTLGADDLTLLRKNLLGAVSLGEIESLAADINGDNTIDVRDLVNMKKTLASAQ